MMTRKLILALLAALSLGGCLSISTSESLPPDASSDACSGKEEQCRNLCGEPGVQRFSCSARPGDGFNFQCECRGKPGRAL